MPRGIPKTYAAKLKDVEKVQRLIKAGKSLKEALAEVKCSKKNYYAVAYPKKEANSEPVIVPTTTKAEETFKRLRTRIIIVKYLLDEALEALIEDLREQCND